MAISDNETAFVDPTATAIGLAAMFNITAGSGDPAYLVLTVLDRNEYTAGASDATGTLVGNGHSLSLRTIGGDGRGAGIVFTYQPATGRYYNSTYGYLDQLEYVSSGSAGDVTNLSLFGTGSLATANAYAGNAVQMMQVDPSGYLGSATVVTRGSTTGTVPSQATPDSIVAAADSFVGQAWNMDGCWVLASTIAAEAGASLPVQSTLVGLPGQANGEWIVAYDGPAGQSGNWQSMVTAGEMVVFETASGGGHITTCVSGSGSSALLVDNVTYVNASGQIVNPANDGSSDDIVVSAPHPASQEFAGVNGATVVIYELDTPVVADSVASDSLACGAAQSLGTLFSATDPANKAIVSWQVYDTATGDSLVLGGTDYSDHAAADALTASTLAAISLLAGSTPTTDTLEVRAYNGSYWGDWQSLDVAITAAATAPAPASPPVLVSQTAGQTWLGGETFTLALPAGAFRDPQNETLRYAATLANGQALPGWLVFNAATDTFSGTAPPSAQTLALTVIATDSSGLSVDDSFSATVIGVPTLTAPTPGQSWLGGKAISLVLPAGTFQDPQGEALAYAATLANGQALPSWLTFNAATGTFSGTAPLTAQTLDIAVTATDSSGLSVTDSFAATVIGAPTLTAPTPNQSWTEGRAFTLALLANTFTDPQHEALSYAATLSNGQALPGWITFNAATDSFSGTAPGTAQTLDITVTATDTSGLSVTDSFAATVVAPAGPVLAVPTPNQAWTEGKAIALSLPAGTFTDPSGEKLSYTATLANGQALPGWLTFNAATESFSGTAPSTAQSLAIQVTATDTSGLTASEDFTAAVQPPVAAARPGIAVTVPTPNQGWVDGQAVDLTLPASTFTDALGLKMNFAAYELSGPNVTSWLYFNPATDTLFGVVPAGEKGMVQLAVVATDADHMTAEDVFSVTFAANPASHGTTALVAGALLPPDPAQVAGLVALQG